MIAQILALTMLVALAAGGVGFLLGMAYEGRARRAWNGWRSYMDRFRERPL